MKLYINQPIFSRHKECTEKNQKQSIQSTNNILTVTQQKINIPIINIKINNIMINNIVKLLIISLIYKINYIF